MTVVAWDGKTLAADRLAVCGRARSSVTKIYRFGGELIGGAGTISVVKEMAHWYEMGADPETFPASARGEADGTSVLIVVLANGTAWSYEGGPLPFLVEDPHGAWGCGNEAALVAMACGLHAAAAVAMVSRFNSACGNGVDALTLDGKT